MTGLDELVRSIESELAGELTATTVRTDIDGDAPNQVEGWVSLAEWKASMLNELFRRHGGTLANITAATVRHGERHPMKNTSGSSLLPEAKK